MEGVTPAGLPLIRYFVCVEQLSQWIAAPGWQITRLTSQRHTTGPSIIQEAVEKCSAYSLLCLCLHSSHSPRLIPPLSTCFLFFLLSPEFCSVFLLRYLNSQFNCFPARLFIRSCICRCNVQNVRSEGKHESMLCIHALLR